MKKSLNKRPWRIISGGQTGVDRAGLTAAMTYCIPIGGWLPKGRLAEAELAKEMGRPYKIVNLDADDAAGQIRDWMLSLEGSLDKEFKKIILNVAGPRESVSPGIFAKAKAILIDVFGWFRNHSDGDLCAIDDDGSLIAWMDAEFIAEMEEEHAKEK